MSETIKVSPADTNAERLTDGRWCLWSDDPNDFVCVDDEVFHRIFTTSEEARAQQRRAVIEDLIERATERRDHFYGIGDIPRGDTFVLILIWLESERDAITGADVGTEAK